MGLTFNLGRVSPSVFTDSSLNVGIGAAPSGTYKLEVTGTAKVSSTLLVGGALTGSAVATFTAAANPLILKSTSATTGYTEYYYNTSTLAGIIGNGGGILTGANNSDFIVRSEADFVVATGGNNRKMTITNGGNVGIGISTGFNVISGTETTLQIAGGNVASLYLNSTGSNKWALFANASGSLGVYNLTASTIPLVISSGDVPTFTGRVVANGFRSSGQIFGFFKNSTGSFEWEVGSDSSVGTGMYMYNPTNGYAFKLTAAGVLTTLGGGTSDIRTKEDIIPITENAISFINELKPVSFKFINDKSKKIRRGFIAQEVLETSIPTLVLGDGELEDGTYGLDYDGILALAVKAIQEQNQTITSLQDRLDKAGL